MDLTRQLGYLLHHLPFVVDRQSDEILQKRLNIGYAQFKILMILQWDDNIQQRQIADRLGQTEASISRQIKLMHNHGWLATRLNPKNRRQHITLLTNKGERIAQKAFATLNEYHAPMFGRLSASQRDELAEILSLMHQEVCSGNKPGRCFAV